MMKAPKQFSSATRPAAIGALSLLLSFTQTGCIVIGGHTGRGGFFFIPGGIVGLLVILLVVSLLRGR